METSQLVTRIQQAEPEGINLKLIKTKIINNWYWFVIFCFIGLVIAFISYKLTPNYFQISTTILVKNDAKSSELNGVFRELNVTKNNPAILDQVGVLKSYNLNYRTVQYFNWRYSWYKKGFFSKSDLYGQDPFLVEQGTDAIQTESLPIEIRPISDTEFEVSCDEVLKIRDKKTNINFKNVVKFGQEFKNEFFQFTLKLNPQAPVDLESTYVLEFNNLSKLALAYKSKLIVKPAGAVDESNLIVVEMTTTNLQRDVDYLNQLGKIYIQFGLDEKNRIANNTIKFIDDQISGVDRSLQIAGDQFSNFRARNKTVDLGQEASSVVEKIKQIETERGELELKLEYYNNLKFYLENRDQNKDLVAPSLVGVTDDALNSKVIQLNELYSRREVLSYSAQEKNPVIISLNNQINYIQKSLRENVDNLISNTQVEVQNLNQRQNSVNAELSRLPKTEQDLIGIKRNFDLNNELYTFLLQRRAEAEISRASNNPDAQILDPTYAGIAILLGPILIINLFIGLFAGFLVATIIVVVKELASEVVHSIEEVNRKLDVSVIGSITTNKYKTELPVIKYPRSGLTESFRGLRLNLDHLMSNSSSNVLAIHSYMSGEGKSFVAINLSLIFAISGKKVLLIDSDLKKPRLHTVFGKNPEMGLSNYLMGSTQFERIIQKTETQNLDFISSGQSQSNTSELLNNGSIKVLIDSARKSYDYIIIDNSPLGLVYDPIMVGMNADYNLILLRLGYSLSNEIEEINKIGRDGILKGLMVAVNGKKPGKGYGYYSEELKDKI